MNRTLARCFSLLFLLPLAACANEHLVDIQVVDVDQGNWLNRVPYSGRDYIEGRPGHRFSVNLHNVTGERVLVVLSVDGVNAISGQTAGSSQAGYVLEPWQQIDVRGWRKSYSDVAEFYFTDLPDSYAARTGRPDNVGVIGVAAFRERRPPPVAYQPPAISSPRYDAPYPSPYERDRAAAKSSNGAADAASATGGAMERRESGSLAAAPQQIGTGHGERRYDPVAQTQFERTSSRPNQRIALFYDSYEALVAKGVIRERYYDYARSPEPFPSGFA
ncbi:MAG: hypothetical protein ABI588_10505, partial [Arenimonas sp.]